jgi:hypothetical protein
MEPIEFDNELWANPPPVRCRYSVAALWRGVVDAGLEPAVYLESLPDFVRWNAATEVIEGLDLGIRALGNWSGQFWLPDAVLKNARDLIERMCEPIEREPEFLGLDKFRSDPRWLSIRADARSLTLSLLPWVEACGHTVNPNNLRDFDLDRLR